MLALYNLGGNECEIYFEHKTEYFITSLESLIFRFVFVFRVSTGKNLLDEFMSSLSQYTTISTISIWFDEFDLFYIPTHNIFPYLVRLNLHTLSFILVGETA